MGDPTPAPHEDGSAHVFTLALTGQFPSGGSVTANASPSSGQVGVINGIDALPRNGQAIIVDVMAKSGVAVGVRDVEASQKAP